MMPVTKENMQHPDSSSFLIGLLLAISSSIFIGTSFIIKKLALRRLDTGETRPSAGGFAYLKQWLWWLGFLTMGVGEAANLVAYAFAPAALVTPLGALSVLVSAILASYFLKEHLNVIGKIGCIMCVVGSIVIVLHAPKEQEFTSMLDISEKMLNPVFLSYIIVVLCLCAFIKGFLGPRYGTTNVTIYLLLCSAVGSLTVVFCKAVALGVKETLEGRLNNFTSITFWGFISAAILCVMTQMNYLNKSLDLFNTGIVTPVYYVMFTILVIVASGVLFKEWETISGTDIVGTICGFAVVIIAIFLLNAFKNIKLSLTDLNINQRRRSSRAEDQTNATFYPEGSYLNRPLHNA